MKSLTESIADQIALSGLESVELISSAHDSLSFGDSEVICRFCSIILRFTKDRGQEFLSIAFNDAPEQFFIFDDVEIAMGWKTIDDVLSKEEPDTLMAVLNRFAIHANELVAASSGASARLTRARVERAERLRGEAYMERLKQMSRDWTKV